MSTATFELRSANASDLQDVEAFLTAAHLPTDGVRDWIDEFIVAEHDGELVGVAGVELYDDNALLRSVATAEAWRGKGLGRALVDAVLRAASERGAGHVYLLTNTAERYFPRLGFVPLEREAAPENIRASVEFQGACPASAVLMSRDL